MCDSNEKSKEAVFQLVCEYIRRYFVYLEEDPDFASYWLNAAREEYDQAGLDSYYEWPRSLCSRLAHRFFKR
jgi:hypothetical protein